MLFQGGGRVLPSGRMKRRGGGCVEDLGEGDERAVGFAGGGVLLRGDWGRRRMRFYGGGDGLEET